MLFQDHSRTQERCIEKYLASALQQMHGVDVVYHYVQVMVQNGREVLVMRVKQQRGKKQEQGMY